MAFPTNPILYGNFGRWRDVRLRSGWRTSSVSSKRWRVCPARMRCMTDPQPQVWPTLRARDARSLIRFLVDAFGFRETVVYGEGDTVAHAQLGWPLGGGIMLGS